MAGTLAAAPTSGVATASHPAVAAHNAAASRNAVTGKAVAVRLDAVVKTVRHADKTYIVRSGDTLSAIAQHYYGRASDWPWLYHSNSRIIRNPDLIYAGEVLKVPSGPPATLTAYRAGTDRDGNRGTAGYQPRHARNTSAAAGVRAATSLSGTLGCAGLEKLWTSAGGAPSAAVTAASIAMAESSGRQYATGSVGERGYWQINPVNGALSTYAPRGNAHAAVVLSHDGTNWTPWTTYTSGAYAGRC